MRTSLWDVLADMEDVELRWSRNDGLLRGARARWFPDHRILVIDSRLKRMVAYCTLAHELAHILLGHEPCDNRFYDQRREAEADQLAATWLIPDLDALAVELATTSTLGHAASNLRVTMDLINARIAGLSDFERRRLDRSVFAVQESMGA